MDDLIAALQIFRKYANKDHPTHCEHDVLIVVGITEDEVSEEDKAKLEELGGFSWNTEYDGWSSFRYGSA